MTVSDRGGKKEFLMMEKGKAPIRHVFTYRVFIDRVRLVDIPPRHPLGALVGLEVSYGADIVAVRVGGVQASAARPWLFLGRRLGRF